MELLKLAIKYYEKVTGHTCSDFYKDLKNVVTTELTTQTGDEWLRHKLVEQVINQGCTLDEVIDGKETMLKYFGVQLDGNIQEYSASTTWGKEVFKLLSANGVDVDNTIFWDIHCISDSLFPTKIKANTVYMSHKSDTIVSEIPTKKGIPFVYDFIQSNNIEELPDGLKTAIVENKPLVLLCCLPIKKEGIKSRISDSMYADGFTVQQDDIHYQYLYRIITFIEEYKLTNCYVGFFGDTSLYTKEKNQAFYQRLNSVLNFKDGFCFSLRDFNSTLLHVDSMHFSLWKTEPIVEQSILLLKKRLVSKTKVADGEKILFGLNQTTLWDWLQPKDVLFYKQAPIMLNYATFRGGEKFEKKATASNSMAENALGTIAITGNMKDIDKTVMFSSVPASKQYVNITEENFWRVVAAFAFSRLVMSTPNNATKVISAPNTEVEDYITWSRNAILMCFFDTKAMFSNLRNIHWEGTTYTVENKMFFLDKEIMSMSTRDNFMKQQIQDGVSNNIVMGKIAEARRYWDDATNNLYEYCLNFVTGTLDKRKAKRYVEDLDSWNAGFSQIVSVFSAEDPTFKTQFRKLYAKYLDYLKKPISMFGFIQDT